jgi:hypothetical protein
VPNVNGGILHAPTSEPKVGNRDRDRERVRIGSESERETLLVQENTPRVTMRHKQQLFQCGGGSGVGGGANELTGVIESDTNSNCALIVDNIAATTAIAAATSVARTINGNNNYELSEFDQSKTQTYNR